MHTLARELVQPWAEMRLQQAGMNLSASRLIRSRFSLTCNEEPQRQQAGQGKKRCSIYKKEQLAKQGHTAHTV